VKLLSIIMPVYNERPFLERIVDACERAAPRWAGARASDRRRRLHRRVDEVLRGLAAKHPRIHLIRQDHNQGRARPSPAPSRRCAGTWPCSRTPTWSTNPATTRGCSSHPERTRGRGVRVAVRQRRQPAGAELSPRAGQPAAHRPVQPDHGFNLTTWRLLQGFRADILRTNPSRSRRFGIEPEITAKIAKRHCVVYEVPSATTGAPTPRARRSPGRDGSTRSRRS